MTQVNHLGRQAEETEDLPVRHALLRSGLHIRTYRTSEGYYIYDPSSSELLEVGKRTWEVMDALSASTFLDRQAALQGVISRSDSDMVIRTLHGLADLVREGDVLRQRPPQIQMLARHPSKGPDVFADRHPRFRKLVLEVSETCNYTCDYCPLNSKSNVKAHPRIAQMSWATAKRAIDFFLDHSGESPTITFFGGEPLLAKYVVFRAAEFLRRSRPNAKLVIQTNGSLLDLDAFSRLRDLAVEISISLDGPSDLQERHRIPRLKEFGSERVLRNLETCEASDPTYVATNVTLTPVLSEPERIEEVIAFFKRHPVTSKLRVEPRRMLVYGDVLDERESRTSLYGPLFATTRERYVTALLSGRRKTVPFEDYLYYPLLKRILWRRPIGNMVIVGAPCAIGLNRLSVTPTGVYRVCERSQSLPAIGDVLEGINWEALASMEQDYLSLTEACRTCWAIGLCTICWIHAFAEGGRPDAVIRERSCRRVRTEVAGALEMFSTLDEQRPGQVAQLLAPDGRN